MIIRRQDYEIVDDWNTVGLMGTGSNTIVVKNVFIPDDHVLNARMLSEGKGLGATLHDAPIFRTAMDFTFSLPLPVSELGIARAAVAEFQERSRKRLASENARLAAEQAATPAALRARQRRGRGRPHPAAYGRQTLQQPDRAGSDSHGPRPVPS